MLHLRAVLGLGLLATFCNASYGSNAKFNVGDSVVITGVRRSLTVGNWQADSAPEPKTATERKTHKVTKERTFCQVKNGYKGIVTGETTHNQQKYWVVLFDNSDIGFEVLGQFLTRLPQPRAQLWIEYKDPRQHGRLLFKNFHNPEERHRTYNTLPKNSWVKRVDQATNKHWYYNTRDPSTFFTEWMTKATVALNWVTMYTHNPTTGKWETSNGRIIEIGNAGSVTVEIYILDKQNKHIVETLRIPVPSKQVDQLLTDIPLKSVPQVCQDRKSVV